MRVYLNRESQLVLIGQAHGAPPVLADMGEDGEKDRGQEAEDGDYDEQFDESKTGFGAFHEYSFRGQIK